MLRSTKLLDISITLLHLPQPCCPPHHVPLPFRLPAPPQNEKVGLPALSGPEADKVQMQMHLLSSASSSPPGRRSIFLGSGLGLTGEWDGGGGGAISSKLYRFSNDNLSLCADKPGLPRSSAPLLICNEDDKPDLSRLGSGERRFRAGNTSYITKPSKSRGNTSAREHQQPSLGHHLLEKGGAQDSS